MRRAVRSLRRRHLVSTVRGRSENQMRRLPLRLTVPALGVCVSVGLLAAFGAVSAPAAFRASDTVKPSTTGKVTTVINVSLGKPTELGIKLSKFSMVTPGSVTFKVTNPGAGWHNFQLCAKAVASAASAKNACVGKK